MANPYRSILLFGTPGVGKGTQGKLLGQHDAFVHLATGDIFRALDPDSDLGREFLSYSTRGELVPDALTIRLWKEYVSTLISNGRYDPSTQFLLLDGIPRSVNQARMIAEHIEVVMILHIEVHDLDTLAERMRLRAEKEGRPDDAKTDVVLRRFEVYREETAPVLEEYDPASIVGIDGQGDIEAVHARVMDAVSAVCSTG